MDNNTLVFSFFLIFTGAAALASLALYTRTPLLIAYIVLGALIGPYGLHLVTDLALLSEISQVGIIFLLFLLGLDMQPSTLLHMFRKAAVIAIVSSVIFATVGYGIGRVFGFPHNESMIIGAAMIFSSTIIGIKLLPTTVLHHKRTGELMVGLLLIQDVIAIFILLILMSGDDLGKLDSSVFTQTIIALPLMVVFAFLFVKYILLKLIIKFDRFHEYIFLLALGWCLGLAQLSHSIGLSAEIGAFIAGISLATSPISQYIATNLRPLRDFFLILFFFSLGARFDLTLLTGIIAPAIVLAVLILVIKPVVFRILLLRWEEGSKLAWDVGFRLGQISEFSLLIAYIAFEGSLIGAQASHLIQATAIITFIVSSYIVVLKYPTPIAINDRLRRD